MHRYELDQQISSCDQMRAGGTRQHFELDDDRLLERAHGPTRRHTSPAASPPRSLVSTEHSKRHACPQARTPLAVARYLHSNNIRHKLII
jgi:hypothetical protein